MLLTEARYCAEMMKGNRKKITSRLSLSDYLPVSSHHRFKHVTIPERPAAATACSLPAFL